MSTLLTYQCFIRAELEARQKRNPRYSLRAFARDLEITAPQLSNILKGQGGLSEASARRIAQKMNLNSSEQDTFVSLVLVEHGRTDKQKQAGKQRLEELKHYSRCETLSLDSFRSITDWYYYAILELTSVEGFQSDTAWIAKRLRLPKTKVAKAVERLFKLKYLEVREDGTWYDTQPVVEAFFKTPTEEMARYHRQILGRAEDAIEEFSLEERSFSSMIFSFDKSRYQEIREVLKSFRQSLAVKLDSSGPRDRVYCFSMHFFPVDRQK